MSLKTWIFVAIFNWLSSLQKSSRSPHHMRTHWFGLGWACSEHFLTCRHCGLNIPRLRSHYRTILVPDVFSDDVAFKFKLILNDSIRRGGYLLLNFWAVCTVIFASCTNHSSKLANTTQRCSFGSFKGFSANLCVGCNTLLFVFHWTFLSLKFS